jgi:hypothetical protein
MSAPSFQKLDGLSIGGTSTLVSPTLGWEISSETGKAMIQMHKSNLGHQTSQEYEYRIKSAHERSISA